MVNDAATPRQPIETEALWDVADVARYLKVSESTIRAYIAKHEIPFFRVGPLIRFRRAEIDLWIEAGRPTPPPASDDEQPARSGSSQEPAA